MDRIDVIADLDMQGVSSQVPISRPEFFSVIDGPILKPFSMVIVHMVRFDIMYGNP